MIPGEFVWFPERGWGVREPTEAERFEYRDSYFERFREISALPPGVALNEARCQFVEKYWSGAVLDCGVGSGAFIERWGTHRAKGFDIADAPRKWLEERGLWSNPYLEPVEVLTAWDVLEHLREEPARRLLNNVSTYLFVSTPIYESADHALRSHHMKPGEHLLYFSEPGLRKFVGQCGFALLERNRMEEAYGREGIGTFAFYRATPALFPSEVSAQ